MPRDYEAIKRSLPKSMPAKERKRRAAKITNARRKRAGKPPMKPHRKKK